MTKFDPFRYFKTSREIIRLTVMSYVRFPLSHGNVEDLLHERGIDVSNEVVRYWWHRFAPMFAAEIRRRRIAGMKSSRWRWHLDEMFGKINGERHYLWRAVDHEGEVLESLVAKTRDKKAALKFLRKAMLKHGRPEVIVTDRLRSYGAALKEIGIADMPETGRWLNTEQRNHICCVDGENGPCFVSGACEVGRKPPPFTLPSKATSIRNAASQVDTISSSPAPPLLSSGAVSSQYKGQLHRLCVDWFESVCQHRHYLRNQPLFDGSGGCVSDVIRSIEDLLQERIVDIVHKTLSYWWHWFGPMFAAKIRNRQITGMQSRKWRWHPGEVFPKLNCQRHIPWWALDQQTNCWNALSRRYAIRMPL